MLTIVIYLLFAICIYYLSSSNRIETAIIGSLWISLLFELAIFYYVSGYVQDSTSEYTIISEQEITSLSKIEEIDGTFFLGCGSVDEEQKYSFYVLTEHGYALDSLSAQNARKPVYLKPYSKDSKETPRVVEYGRITNTIYNDSPIVEKLSLIAWCKYGGYDDNEVVAVYTDELPAWGDDHDDFRYEIYYPEGTLLENFIASEEKE